MSVSDAILGLGAILFGGAVYFALRDSSPVAEPALAASQTASMETSAAAELSADDDQFREARKEAEAGKVFHGPMFRLQRDDGRVNSWLLELAGIPLTRQDEMDDLLDKFGERLSAEMDSRREPIPEESDSAERRIAFRVPADPEAARAAKADFEEEVREKFGDAAARIFTPYATRSCYSGWGEYDLTIRFSMSEGYGGEKRVANFEVVDPATGQKTASGGMSDPDVYRRMFGTAFSDVKFETP